MNRLISVKIADRKAFYCCIAHHVFAPGRRSDYRWLWGQFLDHDTDLTEANTESADIPNPAGDPLDPGFLLAGDIRVNEQITWTAMHPLFMREHNRRAVRIVPKHPSLVGQANEIYQRARRLVGAQIQAITYKEFIPALLGQYALRRYRGYKPNADPRIMNEFSTAAFRLGHSLLSPLLLRLDRHGEEIPAGNLEHRDAFFAPELIVDDGTEPLLRGLAEDPVRPALVGELFFTLAPADRAKRVRGLRDL